MEIALHRVDLLNAASMAPGTLCILPVGKKKGQKVVIGDDSGVLQVLYMKKGEVLTEWKSPELGREITSVCLQWGKDRVFLGCGQSIHGFTRKGKEFVKMKTNLTETINHLFVDDQTIWTGGEFIMNMYENCKDSGSVMIKDRINDLTCGPILQGEMLSSVLACQDKFLRVYQGEKLFHEFSVEGSGTALGWYGSVPERASEPRHMMYGTEQGNVGVCTVDANSMRKVCSVTDKQARPGMGSAKRRARVCRLHGADISKGGVDDVLVGRDDGSFEVWSLGEALQGRAEDMPPTLLFETCLKESIRSLDSGNVTGGEHNEVVMTTYGGKVLVFTPDGAAEDPTGTEIGQQEDQEPATGLAGMPVGKAPKKVLSTTEDQKVKQEKERRYKSLENEVKSLRFQLQNQKDLYHKLSSENIAVQSTTKVTHRFHLNSEEACYVLTVESQAPLEMISLRADVDVDLLDFDGMGAILSRSKGDPASPLLATYRMQDPGSRFQIKLRTVEGLSGSISCFVLPQTNPKIAHLVNLPVKPLSLHEKVTMPVSGPMNELKLSGQFTVVDMHQWLALCVNELPSRPTDDDMTICYKSTFVGTVLHGRYSKGSAVFRSDSIMTISVIKDIVTREATSRKIQLSMNVDVKDETFPRFLELMHPKLQFQHALTQQIRLVEPLKEIELQEGDTKFLAPELRQVLEHAVEIQQQFELQPQRLAFLHNIVTSAYRHKWRLRGHQSVDPRVKDLQKLLENYSMEEVSTFFGEPID